MWNERRRKSPTTVRFTSEEEWNLLSPNYITRICNSKSLNWRSSLYLVYNIIQHVSFFVQLYIVTITQVKIHPILGGYVCIFVFLFERRLIDRKVTWIDRSIDCSTYTLIDYKFDLASLLIIVSSVSLCVCLLRHACTMRVFAHGCIVRIHFYWNNSLKIQYNTIQSEIFKSSIE